MVHEPGATVGPDRRASHRASGSRRLRAAMVAVGACAVVVAGCGSSNSSNAAKQTTTTAKATSASTATTAPANLSGDGGGGALALQQAFVNVVDKVRPEVVQVTSTSDGTTDLGSGVIYDTKGDIVTNAHVVGSATSFQVTFSDGKMTDATLVGSYVKGDLAVVRVSGSNLPLKVATFGDSKALQIGDITLAIGNPLGFSSSVTEGIVSFNGRSVQESDTVTLPSTVQTSAPINPGNSGGALVDLNGDVIGIPTLAATDQQEGGTAAGIGFAIPSDTVKLIVPQLIDTGKVTNSGRAEIGITASDGTGESGQTNGVVVVRVTAGGPAAKAGIVAGDLITAVDGTPTPSLADLQDELASLNPGQKAQVTFQTQSGATRTVTLTLGTLPSGTG